MPTGRRSGRFPAQCAATMRRDPGEYAAPRAQENRGALRRPMPQGAERNSCGPPPSCGSEIGTGVSAHHPHITVASGSRTARGRKPPQRGTGVRYGARSGAIAHHWSHAGTATTKGRGPPRKVEGGDRPRRVPPAGVSRATCAAFVPDMESAMIADRSTDHPGAPPWRRPPPRDRGAPVRRSPMVGFGIVIAPSTGP
jgi:hypothetical protein